MCTRDGAYRRARALELMFLSPAQRGRIESGSGPLPAQSARDLHPVSDTDGVAVPPPPRGSQALPPPLRHDGRTQRPPPPLEREVRPRPFHSSGATWDRCQPKWSSKMQPKGECNRLPSRRLPPREGLSETAGSLLATSSADPAANERQRGWCRAGRAHRGRTVDLRPPPGCCASANLQGSRQRSWRASSARICVATAKPRHVCPGGARLFAPRRLLPLSGELRDRRKGIELLQVDVAIRQPSSLTWSPGKGCSSSTSRIVCRRSRCRRSRDGNGRRT